jgi:protein MPE1
MSTLHLKLCNAGQAVRPPPYYVCGRCQQGGHYKKDCPTNGDPAYDPKKITTGIPNSRTRLLEDQSGSTGGDGVMRLLDGRLVLTVPDE